MGGRGAVGLFLGGILVLASFFIISNVIKLNVLARKTEVEILRLVGASNTFIRVPFLLEGMAMGISGALASLALLFLLIKLFPLYLGSALGILSELINFRYLSPLQAVILVIGGTFIGLSGSLTSLSRFLKV
jgi:cell division transport system permease protein